MSGLDKGVDIQDYPPNDLLKLLASLLSQIASTNDALSPPASPTSPNVTNNSPTNIHNHPPIWTTLTTASRTALSTPSSPLTFHARNIPTITLEAYLLRILKYCPATNDVFLALLVYFDRMAKLSLEAKGKAFVIDSYNVHRLVIAGVTVSSKFFSDVFYTNSRYAKVGGLPQAELNQLELQFLLLNDFRLTIPKGEMQRYAQQLVLFSESSGAGVFAPITNKNIDKKNLAVSEASPVCVVNSSPAPPKHAGMVNGTGSAFSHTKGHPPKEHTNASHSHAPAAPNAASLPQSHFSRQPSSHTLDPHPQYSTSDHATLPQPPPPAHLPESQPPIASSSRSPQRFSQTSSSGALSYSSSSATTTNPSYPTPSSSSTGRPLTNGTRTPKAAAALGASAEPDAPTSSSSRSFAHSRPGSSESGSGSNSRPRVRRRSSSPEASNSQHSYQRTHAFLAQPSVPRSWTSSSTSSFPSHPPSSSSFTLSAASQSFHPPHPPTSQSQGAPYHQDPHISSTPLQYTPHHAHTHTHSNPHTHTPSSSTSSALSSTSVFISSAASSSSIDTENDLSSSESMGYDSEYTEGEYTEGDIETDDEPTIRAGSRDSTMSVGTVSEASDVGGNSPVLDRTMAATPPTTIIRTEGLRDVGMASP